MKITLPDLLIVGGGFRCGYCSRVFSQLKTLEEHEAKHKKARHVKTGDPKKRSAQLIAEKRGRKSIAGECPPEVCWSLTQFYSVDFFTIKDQCKNSAFSTNAQSRFASVDSVLGPPRLAQHT